MEDNACVVEELLRTMKSICTRCRQTKPNHQFSLTNKKMPSKVCDNCRAKAQSRRAEFSKMKEQIDKEFMDMCETEGIPIYANDEYGLFGQVPED